MIENIATVTGQNGIGQNGTDKMVAISIDFNSMVLNIYIFSNHKLQISDKPMLGLNGSGMNEKIILSVEAGLLELFMILSVPFCPLPFCPRTHSD